MPYVTSNKTVAKLKATLEDGTVCELKVMWVIQKSITQLKN